MLSDKRGPVCRMCRREGLKLFLKGARCFGESCAFDRRSYQPGMHRQSRSKPSDYALQLREKQKVKRLYGMKERQFRIFFEKASKMRGISGENLLQLLERRLDNMVYRAGLGLSRTDARQIVRHNHVLVNGKRVNIPSYITKAGDQISITEKGRKEYRLIQVKRMSKHVPAWIERQQDDYTYKILEYPTREDITIPINEQLIVEMYSR